MSSGSDHHDPIDFPAGACLRCRDCGQTAYDPTDDDDCRVCDGPLGRWLPDSPTGRAGRWLENYPQPCRTAPLPSQVRTIDRQWPARIRRLTRQLASVPLGTAVDRRSMLLRTVIFAPTVLVIVLGLLSYMRVLDWTLFDGRHFLLTALVSCLPIFVLLAGRFVLRIPWPAADRSAVAMTGFLILLVFLLWGTATPARPTIPATRPATEPAIVPELARTPHIKPPPVSADPPKPIPKSMPTTARPVEWPERWRNSVGMRFVRIPAGSFVMGSDRQDNEQPQHLVILSSPFYMATTPVTQRQWQAVMHDRPWAEQSMSVDEPDHPATYISWSAACRFIDKLNALEKQYNRRYRLPTEAEWEYACRAESRSAYCFGEDLGELDQYAWYSQNSNMRTHRVGLKKPNAFGLYDMHGNVWQWCADWYADVYPSENVRIDPTGPADGLFHVRRGGSWLNGPEDCRSARRDGMSEQSDNVGFRLVAEPCR